MDVADALNIAWLAASFIYFFIDFRIISFSTIPKSNTTAAYTP